MSSDNGTRNLVSSENAGVDVWGQSVALLHSHRTVFYIGTRLVIYESEENAGQIFQNGSGLHVSLNHVLKCTHSGTHPVGLEVPAACLPNHLQYGCQNVGRRGPGSRTFQFSPCINTAGSNDGSLARLRRTSTYRSVWDPGPQGPTLDTTDL